MFELEPKPGALVFSHPLLCILQAFVIPTAKHYQESQQMDKALARISRYCLSKKKKKEVLFVSKLLARIKIYFEVNENLLTLIQDELF